MMGTIHIVFAITALAVGLAMFLQKKGGPKHRKLGYLYSVAMLLVNVSALSVYQESGEVGPFHILAFISLATLGAGVIPAMRRKPKPFWMNRHAYFMSWSYVGLVAAGVGQMVTMLTDLSGALSVGLPSALIVLVGGFLIHTRVPEILIRFGAR